MYKAVSPLDGRYASRMTKHGEYFSEYALMYYRCKMELLYILALDEAKLFEPLSSEEKEKIQDCIDNFSDKDYQRIKAIEDVTKHDVKACEMFLRERTGV
jgi:adenylosuccinate lyase